MAKVEFWDRTKFEQVESKREYQEYGVAVTFERDSYYKDVATETRTFYVDEETGLVVRDVAQFEQWIAGLGK